MTMLSPDQVMAGESDETRNLLASPASEAQYLLCEETPLWLYVLKEAEAHHGGQRLGAFGSRIVVETLHASIESANPSILSSADWRPDPRLCPSDEEYYTLRDIIAVNALYGQSMSA